MINKQKVNKLKHCFSINDKVKTTVSKQAKLYHQKRKGSIGIIMITNTTLNNKSCYRIRFKDNYEEWYDEDELTYA